MTRLRFAVTLNPSKAEAGDLASYGNVTFAPMDALAEGLGGLDASLEKPAQELAASNYSYFAEGDLLIAKVTPCFENGKKALVTSLPTRIGFATSEVHVVRPNIDRIDPNYLRYLLSSQPFQAAGIASMTGAGGLRRISDNAIKDFQLPMLDLGAQKAVARYLDRATARIDQLIEKKEQFLFTIDLKRKALTASLVDGSLIHGSSTDGASGWFGTLPKHWSVRRARFLFRERIDPSQDGSEELLTVSHITGVTARAEKDVNMFLAETLEGYKVVKANDLVVNTMWAWMGAIGVSGIVGCASPSYAVYRPKPGAFHSEYLDLVVRSLPFVAEVNRRSKGVWASRLRLYPDAFLDIPLPVPSLSEQQQLVEALKDALSREEQIAAKSRRSIALLKERRAALITAAVTGQLDVRDKAVEVKTKPDRNNFRLIVGAEIVHRHCDARRFGRIKNQKLLYLAEVHAGINELGGNYIRFAAGPYDEALIKEAERGMEAAAYYRAQPASGDSRGVTYVPLAKAGQHQAALKKLLGDRTDALRRLIDLLHDFDTETVEAITTLYAVWNDALMNGETPDDAALIRGVLREWHPDKMKFTDDALAHWLAWMRRNGLVPRGQGPRTAHTMTRDLFA